MQQVLWRIPLYTSWTPDGLPIYGFGVMLFLAFILCTWLGGRRAQREGIARERIQDLAIWVFLGGLIGARLTFMLLEDPQPIWVDPFRFFRIWDGGIVLYGAFVGGVLGYLGIWYLSFRKLHISTLKIADIAAPCIALGICLGRMGCFLNGCCFGQVACTDCPVYAVHFPLTAPPGEPLVQRGLQSAGFLIDRGQASQGVAVATVVPGSAAERAGLRRGDLIVGMGGQKIKNPADLDKAILELRYLPKNRGKTSFDLSVKRQGENDPIAIRFTPRTLGLYPTQLYESISMFLLFLFLLAYQPFRRGQGELIGLFMVVYAIHRSLNELLRDDPRPEGFERYFSVVLLTAGLALFLWVRLRATRLRKDRSGPTLEMETQAEAQPAPGPGNGKDQVQPA
jgi:phosphatidylglycerol:prolipoprotein diacylglycerol transferase